MARPVPFRGEGRAGACGGAPNRGNSDPEPNRAVMPDREPGVRGDTASGGKKPATMETGAVITVPLFIEKGEKLRIDTRTGEYAERVKG